ncbi:MAG: sigma 54-interacting transcriptional regulator, partial [Ilumatobacteraceae bacterium]
MTTAPAAPASLPATLGALRASGWQSVPVKEELRRNAVKRISAGEQLFEGVMGYEHTVMPQLENAILAGHDVVFLGERGQAKTRMIRSLTGLLDEWMPVVAGSEINDDPYAPVSRHARDLVASKGDDTPIEWVHRSLRYGEKLATPDTSIADLIGEVDPIKVAEGRYLSDELTLHYGLVPRTNRGIFAINELPDLAERIQVGLLNVLEERDVQIRGYKIRLPLDVILVASANPEDYTNRGRIITPLKDRFGSQIRTHYPLEVETEIEIMRQEARPPSIGDVTVTMPGFVEEVIAEFSQQARASSNVNQRSGVSVRLSVSNYESVCANAVRRALRLGEREVAPRISDVLEAIPASSGGKIEIESLEEGREGLILQQLGQKSVLDVYRRRNLGDKVRDLIAAFDEGAIAHTGSDIASADLARMMADIPTLRAPVLELTGGNESPAVVASAIEFILDSLHLNKR